MSKEMAVVTIGSTADTIDEAAQAAMQMRAGGQQQATGVEQIALAMHADRSGRTSTRPRHRAWPATRQAEKAAQDLNDLARSLAEVVEQYQL